MRYREGIHIARTSGETKFSGVHKDSWAACGPGAGVLASPCGNPSSILGLDTMLRKASVTRVNRKLRRYYLILLLLPNTFTLACLLLSSI